MKIRFLYSITFEGAKTKKLYHPQAGAIVDVPQEDLAHIDKKDYRSVEESKPDDSEKKKSEPKK